LLSIIKPLKPKPKIFIELENLRLSIHLFNIYQFDTVALIKMMFEVLPPPKELKSRLISASVDKTELVGSLESSKPQLTFFKCEKLKKEFIECIEALFKLKKQKFEFVLIEFEYFNVESL